MDYASDARRDVQQEQGAADLTMIGFKTFLLASKDLGLKNRFIELRSYISSLA